MHHSTLKYPPKRNDNLCPHRNLYMNVHSSIIHNRQKSGKNTNIHEFHNEETDMAYLHNGILSGNKEEQSTDTCDDIVQFSSVTLSCPTLCNPMDHSMPGFPVHHQLPEFTQTHVHQVSDSIQPPHPLSSPSPPALNLSQHQGLFK